LTIGENGQDIGGYSSDGKSGLIKFEWKAMTNGGYIIRAKFSDSHWNILKDIATQFYLDEGRRKPTPVKFRITQPISTNNDTGVHLAYMTALNADGITSSGFLDFIAVDPPSYWLNAGSSSGKMYEGNVSSVIKQVVTEYFKEGEVEVSKTKDYDKGQWWMMRMDPKSFIASLLEWSSGCTEQGTNWIVSSDDKTIWIKEQAARTPVNFGTLNMNVVQPAGSDIINFEFLSDTFISVFQKQLITHGLSAVSERYLDRKSTEPPHITNPHKECIVHVHDENTPNKKFTKIDRTRGFRKPNNIPGETHQPHEWSTSIASVPEIYTAQDIGLTYDKYIDGRARKIFLDMLNMVMRIKFRTTGIATKELANCHNLGISKINILWTDTIANNYYFLSGEWLVYGFHHILTPGHYYTDLYCARLDWDSISTAV
jgi:hypothetical protein